MEAKKKQMFFALCSAVLLVLGLMMTMYAENEPTPPDDGETVVFGDLSGDGIVNSLDATILAQYLAGHDVGEIDLRAADINADGIICREDLDLLIRMLVGYGDYTDDVLGPQENSICIFPVDEAGEPVFDAAVEIFVNGERSVYTTGTGVIAIRDIPEGSEVNFNVFSFGNNYKSETIAFFDFDTDGVQIATLAKPTLSIGGGTVSMSIDYLEDNYIDVLLTLEESPGLVCFMTSVKFCQELMEAVSLEWHGLEGFQGMHSPLDGGTFPDSRRFIGQTLGSGVTYATGPIGTTRIKVHGEISHMLPIEIGLLDLGVYAPEFPLGARTYYITSCGYVFQDELFQELSTVPGRTKVGDANGNGIVTVHDAEFIAQYIVSYRTCNNPNGCGRPCTPRCDGFPRVHLPNWEAADIDRNGIICVNDCAFLALRLAGYNLASHMSQYVMDYRVFVNSNGGSLTDVQKYVKQSENMYRDTFNLQLRQKEAENQTLNELNIKSGCLAHGANAICIPPSTSENTRNDGCGNRINGQDCESMHHRSATFHSRAPYLSNHIDTFRFVNFNICAYGREHQAVGGSAVVQGRDMVVSLVSG